MSRAVAVDPADSTKLIWAGQKVKGKIRTPGKMNNTEAAYYQYLDACQSVQEVIWFSFEPMIFKLGDDCRYTPDFAVMLWDGSLELHEVKASTGSKKKDPTTGHMFKTGILIPLIRDDAKVKIQVAAALYPMFTWRIAHPDVVQGRWLLREVKPA